MSVHALETLSGTPLSTLVYEEPVETTRDRQAYPYDVILNEPPIEWWPAGYETLSSYKKRKYANDPDSTEITKTYCMETFKIFLEKNEWFLFKFMITSIYREVSIAMPFLHAERLSASTPATPKLEPDQVGPWIRYTCAAVFLLFLITDQRIMDHVDCRFEPAMLHLAAAFDGGLKGEFPCKLNNEYFSLTEDAELTLWGILSKLLIREEFGVQVLVKPRLIVWIVYRLVAGLFPEILDSKLECIRPEVQPLALDITSNLMAFSTAECPNCQKLKDEGSGTGVGKHQQNVPPTNILGSTPNMGPMPIYPFKSLVIFAKLGGGSARRNLLLHSPFSYEDLKEIIQEKWPNHDNVGTFEAVWLLQSGGKEIPGWLGGSIRPEPSGPFLIKNQSDWATWLGRCLQGEEYWSKVQNAAHAELHLIGIA